MEFSICDNLISGTCVENGITMEIFRMIKGALIFSAFKDF